MEMAFNRERERESLRELCKQAYYVNNKGCLLQGDNVEWLRKIEDNSFDLTVTSPPYDNLRKYKGYSFDFENVAKELYRVTKEGGVVVWIVNDGTIDGGKSLTSFRQALYFQEIGFKVYDTMIWRKPNPSVPSTNRYYDCFEYMFVFSKGKPKALNLIEDKPNKTYGKAYKSINGIGAEKKLLDNGTTRDKIIKEFSRRHNIWDIAVGKNPTSHTAVFPEQLAKDHIISWSNENDIVFDPFMGSGTTAKMAMETNRRWFGIELSQEYCDIIKERLSK